MKNARILYIYSIASMSMAVLLLCCVVVEKARLSHKLLVVVDSFFVQHPPDIGQYRTHNDDRSLESLENAPKCTNRRLCSSVYKKSVSVRPIDATVDQVSAPPYITIPSTHIRLKPNDTWRKQKRSVFSFFLSLSLFQFCVVFGCCACDRHRAQSRPVCTVCKVIVRGLPGQQITQPKVHKIACCRLGRSF